MYTTILMQTARERWVAWLQAHWPAFANGTKLNAPPWLAHPREAAFAAEEWAMPAGQDANWVLALTDGSRVHVHEYGDGRLVVHRDQYDPRRGFGHFVSHLIAETPLVPGLLLFAGLVKLARVIERA